MFISFDIEVSCLRCTTFWSICEKSMENLEVSGHSHRADLMKLTMIPCEQGLSFDFGKVVKGSASRRVVVML